MMIVDKLSKYFNAKSTTHLVIIFIIFAISGSLTLILSNPFISFIKSFSMFDNIFLLFFIRILIILPLYQLVLITVSVLFGEFKYLYNFEKKMFKKLLKKIK